MSQWEQEIKERKRIVYIVDECHLVWGDVCGYVWGPTSERVEIPVVNERERQTYYGALNYHDQLFTVKGYSQGDSINTIKFIEYLRAKHKGKRVTIIWDGASYHRSNAIKDYLESVNGDLPPEKGNVFLIQFAPYAPEQNPVEDIWLKGKTFIRQNFHLSFTFAQIKRLFSERLDEMKFEFPANCAFA